MRALFTLVHRWIGLTTATFLFIAGTTGAIISWDREIDGVLNPDLVLRRANGPDLPALDLARRVEAQDPRASVTYLPLAAEPGRALSLFVEPHVDPATGRLYELGYNQVFLDPATGAELGRREWGAVWPVTKQTLVSFLYKLHFSLHVPEMWGEERWGVWLMGAVALAWTIDCFVGFYLTLPLRKGSNPARPAVVRRELAKGWWARWRPAWAIKTRGSAYRITFDLHRALSLWTWVILLTIAFTAFSLNLYREIFYPVLSTISKVTPGPFDTRTPAPKTKPVEPAITRDALLRGAEAEAQRRGWAERAGAISYEPEYGVFSVLFYPAGSPSQDRGITPATLFYDAAGRPLGAQRPWHGTAADIFVQAQFPLHSGRILGLPGRILISAMGLVVAGLSVTGLLIWWRKRAARVLRRRRASVPAAAPTR